MAQHDGHSHRHEAEAVSDAQIVITINPEARVSAAVNAPLPKPPACGSVIELEIKIINQGFVTAPVRASIIGSGSRLVELHMDAAKLSGNREDTRKLHLIPFGEDVADITVAFSIDNNVGDLGGRDRVSLLVRCVNG
jgi:hypothetical protein